MRAYFKAIWDAGSVPVFIQDPQTTPVPAALTRRIAADNGRVRYAKVESPPQPTQVQAAVQASGGLVTVFGGAGGTYLLEELRRGLVGTMPWPTHPDAVLRIWEFGQGGGQRQSAVLHHVVVYAPV